MGYESLSGREEIHAFTTLRRHPTRRFEILNGRGNAWAATMRSSVEVDTVIVAATCFLFWIGSGMRKTSLVSAMFASDAS